MSGTLTLESRINKAVQASADKDACVKDVMTVVMPDIQLLHGTLVKARELMGSYPVKPGAQELFNTLDTVSKLYDPAFEKPKKK